MYINILKSGYLIKTANELLFVRLFIVSVFFINFTYNKLYPFEGFSSHYYIYLTTYVENVNERIHN